jgi:hypothetical protein
VLQYGSIDSFSGVSAPGPLGAPVGVTISGNSEVVGGTLLSAIHWIRPAIKQLPVSTLTTFVTNLQAHTNLFISLSNATDIILNVTNTDTFKLSNTLTASNFQVIVKVRLSRMTVKIFRDRSR